MTDQLKELSHYGPSLCVKFHETFSDYIFVAVGPYIQVYNYRTGELINKTRAFSCNKVHGFNFSKEGNFCVIYGAKSVSLCSIHNILKSDDISSLEKVYLEWIVDAAFNFNDNQCYLLTCYNLVIVIDLEGNIVEKKNLKNERSILYSGTIKVLSQDKVLINAGTVMGGVLIWDLLKEEKIYNLTGHEGSIFYVVVSDNGKYAASCSDDRSIRLWDLNSGKELSVGWGHTARIWNLKFYNNDTQLISVSEDCTCRIWDVLNANDKVTLVMKNVYETHLNKNVWGVDVQEEHAVVATTGNDGRIKLIDLKQTSRYKDEEFSFNIHQLPSSSTIQIKKGEIFKGFHWFNFGLVAITSLGNVLKFDENTNDWDLVIQDERLVSYSVTNGVSDQNNENNVVIFSNNKSDLLFINFSKDGKITKCSNSLHLDNLSKTYNAMSTLYDSKYCLVAIESPNPREKLIVLQMDLETLQVVKEFRFNKPENFVSSCLEVSNDCLLVGSRFSTVAIFDLNNQEAEPYLIKKISPGDTTTSVKHVETKGDFELFSVTNRDGFYNFIKVNLVDFKKHNNVDGCFHKIIHSNKVIKGFLEGAFYNDANEYITYGFKSSLFYIFNEKNSYEIASQVCGGAHRQWKLCDLANKKGYMLVYVKASELYFRKIYNPLFPETLEGGIHGKEIRDISILPNKINNQYEPKNGYLFVTGSEDTSVKLCKFNPVDGNVVNYWTERKHVSGLQRLKFINDKLLISCSGREELFVWELNTEFESNPYITIRQTLPILSTHPDLRIMDFDILFDGCNNFVISTVYSDSSIKLWYYNCETNKFQEIWINRYQTCCILNTSLVLIESQLYLLIAPTDGYLSFYNISSELPFLKINGNSISIQQKEISLVKSGRDPELSLRVHKSGIKNLDIYIDHNIFYVSTGGDDNAVGLSKFTINDGKIEGETTCMIEKAASSTVTSCSFLDNNSKLLTTSVDQRVRIWDIIADKLVLKEVQYTTVADTGSSDIIKTEDGTDAILIGGVGLSIWKY